MKKYDGILFDLDGTLLPMDMDKFTKLYLSALSEYMRPYGYEPESFAAGIWEGVKAMVANDGTQSNMNRFWHAFSEKLGLDIMHRKDIIDSFYRRDFNKARRATMPNPQAATAVRLARKKFGRVILATNPLFPADGIATRLGWIGLSPADFEYVTTYEVSAYCKPNPMYYKEIAEKTGITPERCLMVGNDISEDGVAKDAGFDVYLITDCLIGEKEELSAFEHSSFSEFVTKLDAL